MKNLLITGASQGIGKATAMEAAKEGMFIGVNYNQNEYGVWLERNSDWNKDWALYRCLKNEFGNKEWYKWPDEYKFRDETSISNFERKRSSCIDKLLLEQFLFDQFLLHLLDKYPL